MNRIDGSELSNYKVTAIQIGQSKTEGINGKKSKYIVLFVKNKKARLAPPRHLIIFEDEEPELISTLLKYKKSEDKDSNNRYTVDLKAFKESDDADTMDGLLEFPGMQVVQYKLRKGLCYMNNVNGERVLKKDKSPIITDTISVLVQVDYILENNGKLETHYFDGYDPETQGRRMEDAFYKETATTIVTARPETEGVVDEEAEETDTPF